MNKLLFLVVAVFLGGCSSTPYVKIGMGYKVHETNLYIDNEHKWKTKDRVSCKIEAGLDYYNISYGIRHMSQCFTGFPFDGENEYAREEIFVDYKYVFKL